MKLATDIHHLSGRCCKKVFKVEGQRSKVNVIARPNKLFRAERPGRCQTASHAGTETLHYFYIGRRVLGSVSQIQSWCWL